MARFLQQHPMGPEVRDLLRAQRGRPKKGAEAPNSTPRSIRFPEAVWDVLEHAAEQRGLSLHAALREAVLQWLGPTVGQAAPTGRKKSR